MGVSEKLKTLLSRKLLLGTSVGVALVFMLAGVIFWGGFNTAMEATNTLGFCISCHEMEENVYQEYTKTVHYNNRSGVRATCSDCHVPDPWVHKFVRKIQASNELLHKMLGSINTPEKFDGKRLQLATNVWKQMKKTDSRECRNCHNFNTMTPEDQKPRARKQHINAMTDGNTCIDCHKGIAHKPVHDQMDDELADKLSSPDPKIAMELPQHWQDFLTAEAATKEEQKRLAAEAAQKAAQEAKEQAKLAAASQASDGTANAANAGSSTINWAAVPAREVNLFYPGESSIEWVLGGKHSDGKHGGSRAFKSGDRCVDCHDEETADIGQKIAAGERLEPNLIAGKRGSIPVSVKAAHDNNNLYMRFEWPDTEHTPAPFVEGGKMDPKNAMKIALMLSSDDVEYADRAGCWGTCHADADSMPFAPEAQSVTKYLTESRTKIETKGRRGKALGGWDKRKSDDEINAELDAGHFMDLIRYKSGEQKVENGAILADRLMDETPISEVSARNGNGSWVVELKRPLTSDNAGDVDLALDQTYNIGFAIHDDYTNARYHHVSLGYKLGFDNGDAEINAVKQ